MAYVTDRKRAVGLGSAKTGTEHFWSMTKSSVALLVLVPLFVFTVGPMIGRPYEEVVAFFARPFPAIVAALTIVVGFMHFKNGVQVAIEDYTDGLTRKALILATIGLSYAAAATGLYALARIAL
jgi:succinate dehydrogenase / fumarate reductase membrane anchor subunit